MPVKFAISSGALSLALLLFGHGNPALAEESTDTSYIYFDNTQYLAASSNVVPMSWSTLQAAFASPNRSDIASWTGLDWTKPYPGSPLSGFTTHLRIADEENGLPKSMHSSWYICQHYYISTLPDPTSDIAHDCSFLPSQCQKDLKASLTKNWGKFKDDPNSNTMCSGWALDYITESCQGTLGRLQQDVLAGGRACLSSTPVDRTTRTVKTDPDHFFFYHLNGVRLILKDLNGLVLLRYLWVQYGYVFNCSGLIVVTDFKQDYYFHCTCIALLHYALHRWYHG
ncbi:hypothetical protein N0V85_006355 [Neurospora sp. IMI 360204]|nr:hypothetical protein N0V85_006355 [Neurospora sp. IMI 360204]